VLGTGGRLGSPGLVVAAVMAPGKVGPGLAEPDVAASEPARAGLAAALAKTDIRYLGMTAGVVDVGTVEPGDAGFRWMRPRERRPDLKSRRDDAGERPGEGGGLDGTTSRRMVMFQYRFLSRFVAVQVHQPAVPMSEEIKVRPLT